MSAVCVKQKEFGPSAHLCTNTGPDRGFNQLINSNHHYGEYRGGPSGFSNTHILKYAHTNTDS